jgi:hypothetical protein
MKQIKLFLSLILISMSALVFGTNYNTVTDGEFGTPTVWKNNIVPTGVITTTDTIFINNVVTVDNAINLGGNELILVVHNQLIISKHLNIPLLSAIWITENGCISITKTIGASNIMFDTNPNGKVFKDSTSICDAVKITKDGITYENLPIELALFKGTFRNSNILINWSTYTETNNEYFELLKSVDGKNFNVIYTIDGAGNSNTIKKYSYIDIMNESSYYRLKQVDYDGKFTLSNLIYVGVKDESKFICITSMNGVIINKPVKQLTPGYYIFMYEGFNEIKLIYDY